MATVPNAPSGFVADSYTATRVDGHSNPNYNGGLPILEYQVAWGVHPNTASNVGNLSLAGKGFISGLTPKTQYYFWCRVRNALGWSPLSVRSTMTMRGAPDTPKTPTEFRNRTQTSVDVMVYPNSNGGSPITSYTLAYGTSPASTTHSMTQDHQLFQLTGFNSPGDTWYFWLRANNIYGSSPWSARGQVNLVAGGYVKVGNVFRRAVPYVKVNGVWRMARTYNKINGVWKLNDD